MKSKPTSIHDLLVSEGYEFVDEAWKKHGRRTYIRDEDATRAYINALTRVLRSAGWETDTTALRKFYHAPTRCVIELEPGGSETTGHFLHFMKAADSETSA